MMFQETDDCAYIALSGDIRDIVVSAIHEREDENCWRGQRQTSADWARGAETVQRRRPGSFVFDER